MVCIHVFMYMYVGEGKHSPRWILRYITLHYKTIYSGQSKKTAKSTTAQVTQQCQDMTAEISVSSVFDEMTTAMLQ